MKTMWESIFRGIFSMSQKNEERFLRWLNEHDSRFHPNAYSFTIEALHYTQRHFKKPKHVTGQELLTGIAQLSREKFGIMAWDVLQEWGIRYGKDFGDIVFNLVEIGEIKKTEEDKIDDFDSGFDLQKAIEDVNS